MLAENFQHGEASFLPEGLRRSEPVFADVLSIPNRDCIVANPGPGEKTWSKQKRRAE